MNTRQIPILLTSSVIAHDPGVSLSKTEERLHYSMQSIEKWLAIAPNVPLVLCDGSNFDFAPHVADRFPAARVEYLQFENNQALVRTLGRGYGEGEIVRYALDHSQSIRKAGCFAKCTSKLWVDNYQDCVHQWNSTQLFKGVFSNVFSLHRPVHFDYLDTRFYIISTDAYQKYYADAHLHIDLKNGGNLEESFLSIFLKEQFKNSLLSVAPVIQGVGGGIGFSYDNSLRRRIKEDFRLWLVKRRPEYSAYFVRQS
jgi:hypothetical protein